MSIFKSASVTGVLLCASVVLSGCGTGSADRTSGGPLAISGRVHGGQQPVVGSAIELYTVGSAGNGSAATPMLRNAVVTVAGGNFNITSDYTCGSSDTGGTINSTSDQVYIVARGGNPGLANGTDNKALVLVAALGDCAKLHDATYVEINEVTTAAAAWALAPFMTSYANVGASLTNATGITNAFLDAALLADTTTGLAATLPSNLSIETGKLYGLADAIASCVNSTGTTGCTPLFTAAKLTGGAAPTDTLSAALNIVKHPGQNVVAVFNTIGSDAPFVSSLTQAPNDWTMTMTVTGSGMDTPTDLKIDQASNVWVTNQAGPLSAFGPQGAPLSDTGYGVHQIAQVFALGVDSVGDIWVTNQNSGNGGGKGSVTEFNGSDTATQGSIIGEYGTPLPAGLAADTNGNMFVANHDSSSATLFTSAGTLLYSDIGADSSLNAHPYSLAVDTSHGLWMSDNDGTIAHISAPTTTNPEGVLLSHPNCCNQSYGVATDVDGTVWVADYLGGGAFSGAFAEVKTDAQGVVTVPIKGSSVGGLNHPALVVVDAGQNVWISNYRGASITEIAGNHGPAAGGSALSPTTGVYGPGGYGLDVALDDPLGIAPDESGNLWVSCEGTSTVVMFFGLATPTVTPVQPVPTAP